MKTHYNTSPSSVSILTSCPHNLSLALGSASVTPLQMASAYAILANGGFRVEPYFIERIEQDGVGVIEQAKPLGRSD